MKLKMLGRVGAELGVAVVALGLGGCACNPDEETCLYVRSYATQLAGQVTLCCARQTPEQRDACIEDVRKAEKTIADHIEKMRQACRDENWDRLESLKQLLPSILPKWFTPPKPTTPTPSEGGQLNAFAVLGSEETVNFNAVASPSGASSNATMILLDGVAYHPAAAGAAVVQEKQDGGTGIALAAAVDEASASAAVAHDYEISSGASLAISALPGNISFTVSGTITLSEFMPWKGSQRAIPIDMSLLAERGATKTKVSVDATHPNNMAVFDPQTGAGVLRFMATLNPSMNDVAVPSPVSQIWIEAPFVRSAATGAMSFTSAGAVAGSAFFPAVALPQALMDHTSIPVATATGELGPDCADSDGDGIPNLAEAMYNIYRSGFPGCQLEPLGAPAQ